MIVPHAVNDNERASILLVDDRPANLVALEAILSTLDVELVMCASGPDALQRLEAREFAVVLLDLQMPVMDGIATAMKMRELGDAQHRTVPIIFLTATDVTTSRVLGAYASGAVDFLQKPFEPQVLRSKVSVFADLFCARQRLVAEIEQRRRLQEALRARDDMLAIVSHDLRGPLNAILLRAEQIERAAGAPDLARVTREASAIRHAVDRMSMLVGNLLDLATLEAGQPLVTKLDRHDVAELARETTQMLEPLAESGELTLHTELVPATYVLCDPHRIQQVLANLVGNAIKFNRRGGFVHVSAEPSDTEVIVSVRDGGPGIRHDQVSHIFDRYWKADPHRKSGVGLGLSIAKAIVETHGGRIRVETAEGAGSAFFFALPSAEESKGQPESTRAEPVEKSITVAAVFGGPFDADSAAAEHRTT